MRPWVSWEEACGVKKGVAETSAVFGEGEAVGSVGVHEGEPTPAGEGVGWVEEEVAVAAS